MRYLIIIGLQFLFIPSGKDNIIHGWTNYSEAYQESRINRYFNGSDVEIDVVSVGCFHYDVYKMIIHQKEGKHSLEFYVKDEKCDHNNEFSEDMIRHAKYLRTYSLTSEKLQQLKKALIPDEYSNSTSCTSWSIINGSDTLKLSDCSGSGKIRMFIENLQAHS